MSNAQLFGKIFLYLNQLKLLSMLTMEDKHRRVLGELVRASQSPVPSHDPQRRASKHHLLVHPSLGHFLHSPADSKIKVGSLWCLSCHWYRTGIKASHLTQQKTTQQVKQLKQH